MIKLPRNEILALLLVALGLVIFVIAQILRVLTVFALVDVGTGAGES